MAGQRAYLFGQAPGPVEGVEGRPWRGRAVRALRGWLELDEAAFYATFYCASVTRCDPGRAPSGRGDRTPTATEQRLCEFWHDHELALLQPRLVVTVGGLDGLIRLVEEGELEPDDGPSTIDTRSGVVLVGARAALVAYNVELATDDIEVVRAVAASVRASGGGMPGVQAIGLLLPESRRAQVSMNVIDVERAPLHEVVRRVRDEAAARGVDVRGGELVGLVPASVVRAADDAGAEIPGVDASRVLENVLRSRLAE